MINSISVNSHHFANVSQFCKNLFNSSSGLAEKIQQIAYPYFTAGSGVYYCGSGGKEIYSATVGYAVEKRDVFSPSRLFQGIQGFFITATGVCGVAEAFNSFDLINYGGFTNSVYAAGNIFFLCANLVALEDAVRVYEEIQKAEGEGREIAEFQKQSNLLGIISNLGYIMATALILFGGSTAMALVLGIIGSFSGAMKILYDYLPEVEKIIGKLSRS